LKAGIITENVGSWRGVTLLRLWIFIESVPASVSDPRVLRIVNLSHRSTSACPRILFVCSSLIVGGAQRQWALLIPRLKQRFVPFVLTLVDEGPFFDQLRDDGVSVDCVRMRRRTDVRGWRQALSYAAWQPDIVVTQSIDADVVGGAIAWRAGVPHITTEHAGPGAPSRLHQDLLRRLVARRMAASVAVSAVQVPRLVRLGYPRHSIHVIPNGVPVPEVTRERAAVREALEIPPDAVLAVLVAAIRPEKRPDVFIAAVEKAHRANRLVRGVIAGDGSELPRVRELAGSSGVVRVLGHRDDVADLLAAADAVCLSSDAEGTPMVALEAMALGKPVVATKVGGVPQVVEDHSTGLLVPPHDPDAFAEALLQLASSPELARRLGERGRVRHGERFNVERMVDGYARLFDDVLALRS
jgi:glycosyltransferase involved in cell wall biosynthesis